MAKNLVIVESPNKVKTIKKFLGRNYEVIACQGHIRDMPKSTLGIDIENDFEPKYITIRGKGTLLSGIRKEAKKAEKVYLATDPDREGEAISWHLTKAIPLEDDKFARITFNEITQNAVKNSLKSPRKIDMDLVDAQQARRMLDRIVGYKISPLLWAKVKRGLSAGRVQSAALHMIREREDEINEFIPTEYYTVSCKLMHKKLGQFLFSYHGEEGKKTDLEDYSLVQRILSDCKEGEFKAVSIKTGERIKKRPLPFTTSTMQQEASKQLNFSVSKTMRVAQSLYEGKDIPGHGLMGLISYLRTDSIRVSDEAREAAHEYISGKYGKEYVGKEEKPKGGDKKRVQDSHEAIRPALVSLTPEDIKSALSRDEYRLYTLIWKRFIASQMENAVYETASAKVACAGHYFTASSSEVSFEGYLKVYGALETAEEDSAKSDNLAKLSEGDLLTPLNIEDQKHFTKPAPHFNEGSLVKAMEEMGIGRPSTFSPTINTLLKRHYVTIDEKNIYLTELGEVVDDIMSLSFPDVVDDGFTADMETRLDSVEEGQLEWKSIVRDFYPGLEKNIQKAEKELEKVKIEDEVTDVICESCGRNMVIKYGPHGKFLACPGFPECRNTKPYFEKIGVGCPKCGKDVVLRKTRKGRKFFGCEDFPDCDFSSWSRPVEKKCPRCGLFMTIKGKKLACSSAECGYSESAEEKD